VKVTIEYPNRIVSIRNRGSVSILVDRYAAIRCKTHADSKSDIGSYLPYLSLAVSISSVRRILCKQVGI
jgi:hypothetical protein